MMGYKIWRKDHLEWSLAYDTVFQTREAVDEHIYSLNAQWAEKVKYGELIFYPYRDDIKLDKDGNIISDTIQTRRGKRTPAYKRKRK